MSGRITHITQALKEGIFHVVALAKSCCDSFPRKLRGWRRLLYGHMKWFASLSPNER